MSQEIKIQLISAGTTFLSTFLSVLGVSLSMGTMEWSAAFWGGIILVAVRAAAKAVISKFVPVALGGKKA